MHARLFGAALAAFCLTSWDVAARPNSPPSHSFAGDRYQFADLGSEVVRSVKRNPVKPKKWKKRKGRAPVHDGAYRVQRTAPVPSPVARPAAAPGADEEAANAADETVVWGHPLAAVLPAPTAPVHGNLLRAFARELARAAPSRPLTGVVPPLAEKASQIMGACPGARVISAKLGRERSVVRGSGRPSLHRSGRAVDMAGNPRCIYAQLRKWRGGVSTDYSAVAHVHFSFAPRSREWGARFVHWRPSKRANRYARRNGASS